MPPRYRGLTSEQIPEAALPSGVQARVVCGTFNGIAGPVRDIVTDPAYFDITVPPGTTFEPPVKDGHTVLAYVYEGQAYFDECRGPYSHDVKQRRYFDLERQGQVSHEHVVLYATEGDHIAITTESDPAQFLLVSGQPRGEPVAWSGPIVMNTKDELRLAFEEYRNGTFIKGA